MYHRSPGRSSSSSSDSAPSFMDHGRLNQNNSRISRPTSAVARTTSFSATTNKNNKSDDDDCKNHGRARYRCRWAVTYFCHVQRRPLLLLVLGALMVDWCFVLLTESVSSATRRTLDCNSGVAVAFAFVDPAAESSPFLHSLPDRQTWRELHDTTPVVTSLCHACLLTRDSTSQTTCGEAIYKEFQQQQQQQQQQSATDAGIDEHDSKYVQLHQAWMEAARVVAARIRTCQAACFDHCRFAPLHQRQYWRHDAAAPYQRGTAVSHLLTSIPDRYRLPPAAVSNLETYMTDPANRFPTRTYLFEYNPTIVMLPHRQVVGSEDDDEEDDEAVYLASYRVTNFQYCFKSKAFKDLFDWNVAKNQQDLTTTATVHHHPPTTGLVALALLRDDFSVITDITIDVSSVMRLEDPRLFVLHGQLYLASFEFIVPFWLGNRNDQPDTVVLHDFWKSNSDDNQKANDSFSITMRSQPSCCTSPFCAGGKNFNYFTTVEQKDSSRFAWVETNPMAPRLLEQVDLFATCDEATVREVTTPTTVYRQDNVTVRESFATMDQLILAQYGVMEPPYSSERGTACCIRVPSPLDNDNEEWLIGVSHTKSRRVAELQSVLTGRQYYSRLYAFQAHAPFSIMAVSGTFCMGLPQPPEMTSNYFNQAAPKQTFLMGTALACPKISFVSGIAETADPTKAVISYGINDCTGRSVVVDKSDLIAMLVDPASRLAEQND